MGARLMCMLEVTQESNFFSPILFLISSPLNVKLNGRLAVCFILYVILLFCLHHKPRPLVLSVCPLPKPEAKFRVILHSFPAFA
jgi:hypothetical protein